jgi:protein TonB
MSATTVNAFPPLHTFNSSRSWFIALIVLVHLGFFWALGQGRGMIVEHAPPFIVDFLPAPERPLPPPKPLKTVEPVVRDPVWVQPTVVPPVLPSEDAHPPIQTTQTPLPPPIALTEDGAGSGPLIVEAASDPRYPFTEPEYPVSEIRQGHEGTVLLRVQILPNGRVGAVQVEQSSGFVKLDESAVREAHRYRMKPGTHDGVAMAMWVRVPVKFRLKDRN